MIERAPTAEIDTHLTDDRRAATRPRRQPPQALLGCLWCGLGAVIGVWVGVPFPRNDDLFYTGAAIRLASVGELANPWLAGQEFLSRDFLIYPPFYQWVLAAWLKLFGLSTLTLLTFQYVCYSTFGFCFSRLLLRENILVRNRWWWPGVFAAAMFATIGTAGLRPDALGFAVLAAGLLLRAGSKPWVQAVAWTLVFSALAVSPNVLPYALGGALFTLTADYSRHQLRWSEACAVGVGGVAALTLFYASIDGRIAEFLAAFFHHAQRAVLPPLASLAAGEARVWALPVAGPLYTLVLGATALLLLHGRRHSPSFSLVVIIIFLAVVAVDLASVLMTWLRSELRLFTATLWVTGCLGYALSRPALRAAGLAISLSLVIVWTWQLLPTAAHLAARGRPSAENVRQARAAVAAEPNRRFLIDDWAARHVFDYQLPANTLIWSFAKKFPWLWPESLAEIKPDETWIIFGSSLRLIAADRLPGLKPAFTLAGRSQCYYPADREVFVIDGRKPVPAKFGH